MGLFRIPTEYANYEWFDNKEPLPQVKQPSMEEEAKETLPAAIARKPKPSKRKPKKA